MPDGMVFKTYCRKDGNRRFGITNSAGREYGRDYFEGIRRTGSRQSVEGRCSVEASQVCIRLGVLQKSPCPSMRFWSVIPVSNMTSCSVEETCRNRVDNLP